MVPSQARPSSASSPDSASGSSLWPPLGAAALVLLILVGTALAVWFYLRGPVVQSEPRPQHQERDSRLDGNGLTREDGAGLARRGS